jgi:2'-5' RNA ligase
MRLFVALDIDPEIRENLAQFRSAMKSLAPSVRWVSAESFHITLKFIGEQPPQRTQEIKRVLGAIRALPTTVSFRGAGFFPNPRSARVFWAGVEADEQLEKLARQVDEALATLKIASEERAFTPHLTLARGGDSRHPRGGSGRPGARPGDRPNALFAPVQQKLAAMAPPDFGTMTANEFFLYESRLSPAGAHYTKLAKFPLTRDEKT